MPAWLGWVAVVLLSLYLAVYPAAAAGLAWRWGRQRRRCALVLALRRRLDRHRMASRQHVHRLRLEPARGRSARRPRSRQARALVGTYGLSGVAAAARGRCCCSSAAALAPGRGRWRRRRRWPLAGFARRRPGARARRASPLRIVQPNIGQQDKWREGFERENMARLARLSTAGAATSRGSCSGPKPRSPGRSRTASRPRPIGPRWSSFAARSPRCSAPKRSAPDRRRHLALGRRPRA